MCIWRTADNSPPNYASSLSYGMIMRQISKSSTSRCTLMELSLADRGDGEELIDTKIGGVHLTDSWQQPSKVCLKPDIWASVCSLCGKFLNRQVIDAHSWNKVELIGVMERSWWTPKLWVCIRLTADNSPPKYASSLTYGMGISLLIMRQIQKFYQSLQQKKWKA